jgi:hypothetical protein
LDLKDKDGKNLTSILVYSSKEASRQDISLIPGNERTLEESGITDGMQLIATECIT